MNIRPATDADIPAVIRIGHEFFAFNVYREHSALDEESLEVTLRALIAEHVLLVGEVEGKVIGTAGAMIAPLYWNFAQKQGIEFFYWIDPEHRGNGNGKRLHQALEAAGKEKGASFWNMIALEASMPEQVGAMYRKAGFQLVEHTYMKVL